MQDLGFSVILSKLILQREKKSDLKFSKLYVIKVYLYHYPQPTLYLVMSI